MNIKQTKLHIKLDYPYSLSEKEAKNKLHFGKILKILILKGEIIRKVKKWDESVLKTIENCIPNQYLKCSLLNANNQ